MVKMTWYILGVLIILVVGSYFMSRTLPGLEKIDNTMHQAVIQKGSDNEVIEKNYKGVEYQITPLYTYEISGLIVSLNDNNIWYSRFKNIDPLNTKDFCLIWGGNLKNVNYLNADFKTEEFVCFAEFNGGSLDVDEISNNHLLPANDKVYRIIRRAGIGDQVRISGYLANYSAKSSKGEVTRDTSIVRSDTGNGACETVYVENIEIINNQNQIWRVINLVSKYLITLCVLLLIFLPAEYG